MHQYREKNLVPSLSLCSLLSKSSFAHTTDKQLDWNGLSMFISLQLNQI